MFTVLLLLVFGTFSLINKGIISKDYFSIIQIQIIGSIMLSWYLIANYQRKKIFRPLIEDKLKEHGYILKSEKPLSLGEIFGSLEFVPTILVNETLIENFKYKARNERMLHVKTNKGIDLLLHAVITKTWGNKIKLEIIKEIIKH